MYLSKIQSRRAYLPCCSLYRLYKDRMLYRQQMEQLLILCTRTHCDKLKPAVNEKWLLRDLYWIHHKASQQDSVFT